MSELKQTRDKKRALERKKHTKFLQIHAPELGQTPAARRRRHVFDGDQTLRFVERQLSMNNESVRI